MNFASLGILIALGMFAATLCVLALGRKLGARRRAGDAAADKSGTGAMEGAIFGLMGLLIAFTFSGAAARFDTRRAQIVQEANCIGTAWLRLDLLPSSVQPSLREKLRQYTDARIEVFRKLPDAVAAKVELDRAAVLQNEIWQEAVAACRLSETTVASMLLLPALNEMFDMAATRTMGARTHVPPIIFAMLALLVLAGALLTGYDMGESKSRNWLHALAFVLVVSLAVYVILDFEFPRIGIIRIHGFDHVFMELRQSMNP
jgi:hypothetical protein